MSERDNSGQAFPSTVVVDPDGDPYIEDQGMTLRDWFAGQVLPSLILNNGEESAENIEINCIQAYQYADAMLKTREE